MVKDGKQIVFDISQAISDVAYESTNYNEILAVAKAYFDHLVFSLDYPTEPSLEISAQCYPLGLCPNGLEPNNLPVSVVHDAIDRYHPKLMETLYQFIQEHWIQNCYLSSVITKNHYAIIIRK